MRVFGQRASWGFGNCGQLVDMRYMKNKQTCLQIIFSTLQIGGVAEEKTIEGDEQTVCQIERKQLNDNQMKIEKNL